MRFSANGLQLLKNLEGFRGKPYKCAAGRDTVGYGTVITPAEVAKYTAVPISREEAEKLALQKVNEILFVMKKVIRVQLTQNQIDATVCFIYNIGVNAFKSSTFLRKLNDHNFQGTALEMSRWVHDDHGNVIDGLVARHQKEKDLFLKKAAGEIVEGKVKK